MNAPQAIPSIEVEELQKLLASGDVTLIDVREPRERDLCAIPGALLIPLGQLPDRMAELPREGMLVLQCHHGGRSGRAVSFLQENGFKNAVNLAGGIHAWAQRIDTSMGTY